MWQGHSSVDSAASRGIRPCLRVTRAVRQYGGPSMMRPDGGTHVAVCLGVGSMLTIGFFVAKADPPTRCRKWRLTERALGDEPFRGNGQLDGYLELGIAVTPQFSESCLEGCPGCGGNWWGRIAGLERHRFLFYIAHSLVSTSEP